MSQIGVFAKYWQPGAVKTRLAAAIGDEAAAHLYHLFLQTTLQRFAAVAERRTLVYWPVEQRREFAGLAGEHWDLAPQSDGDLGQRLHGFFDGVLSSSASRAVVIGSDSPSLPAEFVELALERLRRDRVVLGPSRDGGYYLVGFRGEVVAEMFHEIPWGTSKVLACTIEVLRARETGFTELPAWYDVDTYSDLQRLQEEIADRSGSDAQFGRLREALDVVLA